MNIRPYPKNAKQHPKKQIEQIAASIKEFGMQQDVIVDKQGYIIVGHGRYEAMLHLGWSADKINEYVKVADLTEEQAKSYRLADNKLSETDWDMDMVVEELSEMDEYLELLTGFNKDLLVGYDKPEEKKESAEKECPNCGEKL